jgi:transcriptional antiterminator RfaH
MGWWVAVSKPNAESSAAKYLDGKGYEVYNPQVLAEVRHANRSELVARPFLPRYLFVRTRTGGVRGVLSTTGVSSLLSFGDSPAIAPDGVIDELKSREVDGVIELPKTPEPVFPFNSGDSVVVKSELMGDIPALFSCRQAPGRVRVFIQLLGKWHKATVPLGSVYSAAP